LALGKLPRILSLVCGIFLTAISILFIFHIVFPEPNYGPANASYAEEQFWRFNYSLIFGVFLFTAGLALIVASYYRHGETMHAHERRPVRMKREFLGSILDAKVRMITREQIVRLEFALGAFLAIVGLFLPWASQVEGQWFILARNFLFGIELPIGNLALIGCIITAVLFFGRRRSQKISPVLMLVGALICVSAVFTWILQTQTLAWNWEWRPVYGIVLSNSGGLYEVAYGTYVSLAGSVMITVGVLVKFLGKQLNDARAF
jgi:hypothetical protein